MITMLVSLAATLASLPRLSIAGRGDTIPDIHRAWKIALIVPGM
jgi:hypothetical protein